MVEVTNNSDGDTRVRHKWQTHSTTETLIFFRVIITQLDLQVGTLAELTLLAIGEHLRDKLLHLL